MTIETRKSHKTLTWVIVSCVSVGVLLLLIIFIVFAAHSSGTTLTNSGHEVEYEVTGTAPGVNITFFNASGDIEQHSNVAMGSSYSYTDFPSHALSISAQNIGDSGTVTVNIYYDGVLDKTTTSTGAYVIAQASDYK